MRVLIYLLGSVCFCSAGTLVKMAVSQDAAVPVSSQETPDLFGQADDANQPLPTQSDRSNAPAGTTKTPLPPTPSKTPNPFGADLSPVYPPAFPEQVLATRPVFEYRTRPVSPEELESSRKLQAAVRVLRSSKEEAARKQAIDSIQQHLNGQFERDLQQREKQLADVEARVKTLRDQLEKRKAAREEIIGLRLKTVVNDADGLGFPGSEIPSVDDTMPSGVFGRSSQVDTYLAVPGSSFSPRSATPGLFLESPRSGPDSLPPAAAPEPEQFNRDVPGDAPTPEVLEPLDSLPNRT